MRCIICEEDKKRKSFLVKQELQEGVWFEKEIGINKKICEDCFKPESLGYQVGDRFHIYIKSYAEEFKQNFWAKSEIKRDDLMSMIEVTNTLLEKGIKDTIPRCCARSEVAENDYKNRRGRQWVDRKDPNVRFKMMVPTSQAIVLGEASFVKKEDFDRLIKLPREVVRNVTQITYTANCKHKLSKERLDELHKEGWVKYGVNKEPRFGNHLIHKKRACVICGEIKDWEGFRVSGQNNVRECLDCEKIRTRKYYVENQTEIREKAKTPEARKRRRELDKTTKYKYSRAIRSRLKRYVKTAFGGSNPTLWNKNTEITNREFVELLEDLSEEWMSEHNYGVGLNLDHEGAWHIDHVIPLCLWEKYKHINPFYKKEREKGNQIGPNHWTNLRPLCAKENMRRETRDLNLNELASHYQKLRNLYPKRFTRLVSLADNP